MQSTKIIEMSFQSVYSFEWMYPRVSILLQEFKQYFYDCEEYNKMKADHVMIDGS